jgi:hypothetical protein
MSTTAAPAPDEARPSLRTRARRCWQNVADCCAKHWMAIRPGPEARRGAVCGTLAAAAACVVLAGLYLRTGFGSAFDFAFAILFAAVLIPLVAVVVALLLTIAGTTLSSTNTWSLSSQDVSDRGNGHGLPRFVEQSGPWLTRLRCAHPS